jgi:hypothetical protein
MLCIYSLRRSIPAVVSKRVAQAKRPWFERSERARPSDPATESTAGILIAVFETTAGMLHTLLWGE